MVLSCWEGSFSGGSVKLQEGSIKALIIRQYLGRESGGVGWPAITIIQGVLNS